jgi:NSS family neurotransmitter:Na+ symporter
MKERESLSSRLGFILLSAGCAIGLGNVWRFPYIVGAYGGAAFVLIYLVFLVILGIPIMTMEFAVGRASQKSVVKSYYALEPQGTKWHVLSYFALAGNYILMMFYTTVTGWMIAYFWYSLRGDLVGLDSAGVSSFFGNLLANPFTLIQWMAIAVIIGSIICIIGLRQGVERITKVMMIALFALVAVLAIHSVMLKGASAGLQFYLKPSFNNLVKNGIWTSIYAAMGQAFFTLSIGIGSMAIFGSYIGKEHALMGESMYVIALDTFVAIMAGFIIFPVCSAYGVDVSSGPGLIFISLPNMFNHMFLGNLWGTLFFLFMSFAAMSTVVAVFEHIIANSIDILGWSRKSATLFNMLVIFVLSIPCALGFNVWSSFAPLGKGSVVLDLEDFLVSNNILLIGAIVYILFCTSKHGWGWDNFITEANTGKGIKFPKCLRWYVTYVAPVIVFVILVYGYIDKFKH